MIESYTLEDGHTPDLRIVAYALAAVVIAAALVIAVVQKIRPW